MKYQHFDYTTYLDVIIPLLKELERDDWKNDDYPKIIKRHTKINGDVFSKDEIIKTYKAVAGQYGLQPYNEAFLRRVKMKPVRTVSGVTPITVLTKPFPCPGKCIFCPNDIRMPKSYLSDEPGAQRAERNYFDPYLQTYNRLQALSNIGHGVSKAEIIILGGTWSYYPLAYQIWFVSECFRAMNDFENDAIVDSMKNKKNNNKTDGREVVLQRYQKMLDHYKKVKATALSDDPEKNKQSTKQFTIKGEKLEKTYNQTISQLYVAPERIAGFDTYQQADWEVLEREQKKNETAKVRCVGLVIETRPDNISPAEVKRIRRLGCTKTQIGFQSLQDEVLEKNNRGHDVEATRRAVRLLRQAGFKIHAHWMANLYGSSVELDKQDYVQLFEDPDFKPDELKIYPCSLIESAELMQYYKKGLWKPYTHDELLEVVKFAFSHTPPYCRLTRVIRDIPSTDIVVGNKLTNFRQIAQQELEKEGGESQDIRAREVRFKKVEANDLEFEVITYETSVSTEHFLQCVAQGKLVGFLRLSLPTVESFMEELVDAAIIREVHVYGQSVAVGDSEDGKAQHLGVGRQLIERAEEIASNSGFKKLAVISAVGTREYYRKRGFDDGELYQHKKLK